MDVHTARWRADELRKIGETDDLHISPFREDGPSRTKYAGSPYLTAMIGGRARAATVAVLPRG
jgi:hypothetical protein